LDPVVAEVFVLEHVAQEMFVWRKKSLFEAGKARCSVWQQQSHCIGFLFLVK
jgi:hypothetical protein